MNKQNQQTHGSSNISKTETTPPALRAEECSIQTQIQPPFTINMITHDSPTLFLDICVNTYAKITEFTVHDVSDNIIKIYVISNYG